MAEVYGVAISKMDILMENYSNIRKLINNIAIDREKLLAARNTWEVFFAGYDDDPREIPDIPEVVNWIEQSIEEGIPWFYFMRTEQSSLGLLTFMICYGSEPGFAHPGCQYFARDRVLSFIQKNLNNLSNFSEENNISDEIRRAVTDNIMASIQNILQGSMKQEKHGKNVDKNKQLKEALYRLSTLEKLVHLNPNVKKYFIDGKLYYSYITGGGYIGSIDTINYDKRYAAAVEAFEKQMSCLVYHVIERGNTISILFVGDDYNHWLAERPTTAGVMAQVVNVDTNESKLGYIKIDSLQGALYRTNDIVYTSMPEKTVCSSELSAIDSEIVERLEILKNKGMITDLDITAEYQQEGVICCSLLRNIFGTPVGVVNRISAEPAYEQLLEILSKQIFRKIYFLMGSTERTERRVAFLFLSDDSSDWELEKLELEKGVPHAIVVDIKEMTAVIQKVKYTMVNGGPICILD